MNPRILGAIYVGGKSSRFQRDKTTALYQGRTFLDHVITTMVPQVEALVLLGGHAKPPWPVLEDSIENAGPLGGLLAALGHASALGYDWVATAPCDMPCLPPNYVTKMLHNAKTSTKVVVAETVAGWQPVIALWRVMDKTVALSSMKQGFSLNAAIKCTPPFVTVRFPVAELANINDQPTLAKLRACSHLN